MAGPRSRASAFVQLHKNKTNDVSQGMKQAFVKKKKKGCANNPADLAFVTKKRGRTGEKEEGRREKEGGKEANTNTGMAQAER